LDARTGDGVIRVIDIHPMTGYVCLNSRLPLAEHVAIVLDLECEYDALSCKFFFCHRVSGATFSYSRFEAGEPGPWMSELRSAVDLLNTFDSSC
jgi:hypothetical protein